MPHFLAWAKNSDMIGLGGKLLFMCYDSLVPKAGAGKGVSLLWECGGKGDPTKINTCQLRRITRSKCFT